MPRHAAAIVDEAELQTDIDEWLQTLRFHTNHCLTKASALFEGVIGGREESAREPSSVMVVARDIRQLVVSAEASVGACSMYAQALVNRRREKRERTAIEWEAKMRRCKRNMEAASKIGHLIVGVQVGYVKHQVNSLDSFIGDLKMGGKFERKTGRLGLTVGAHRLPGEFRTWEPPHA